MKIFLMVSAFTLVSLTTGCKREPNQTNIEIVHMNRNASVTIFSGVLFAVPRQRIQINADLVNHADTDAILVNLCVTGGACQSVPNVMWTAGANYVDILDGVANGYTSYTIVTTLYR